MPATGRRTCAAWFGSPRRCGPLSRTATGCSRSSHRTPCSPTPSSRPPEASTRRCRVGGDAPGSGTSARVQRVGRPIALRGCRRRLLGALSPWAAGGRAAADLDPPRLWLGDDGQAGPARGGHTVSVHPLLGAHVRVQDEPERHVWQAERRHRTPTLAGRSPRPRRPGVPRCGLLRDGAGRGAHVLGDAAEARDIRFEQALLLDERTTVGAVASHEAPGVFAFAVETTSRANRCATPRPPCAVRRRAPAGRRTTSPRLLAAHPTATTAPRSESG